MLVSVVVTVRNEIGTIRALLDSLLVQEAPFEVVVVDAESSDGTWEVLKEYAEKHDEIRVFQKRGSRGRSRNFGVKQACGEVVVFTDGGCTVDLGWIRELRKSFSEGFDIVAGKTVNVGPFSNIRRVEVEVAGFDITFPSCNLGFGKVLFEKIGGFDTRFITAEDVDLNLRALEVKAKPFVNDAAVVYRNTAQSYFELIKQSFWYGYGRKQLTLKHGRLWSSYSPQQMFLSQLTVVGGLRLFFGLLGYMVCKIRENTY